MGTRYLPDVPPSPWQRPEVSGSVKSMAGHLPSTEITEKAGRELQCPGPRGFNGLGIHSGGETARRIHLPAIHGGDNLDYLPACRVAVDAPTQVNALLMS